MPISLPIYCKFAYKCQCYSICEKVPMRKLNFNNLVIENVKEFKYLGVHLYFLEQVLFINKKKPQFYKYAHDVMYKII